MPSHQKPWKDALTDAMVAIENLTGVFLVTQGKERKPNIMTIGWLQGGIIWGRPILMVLVRPSRFTHVHLEENPHFTVCLPTEKMRKEIDWCGTLTGASIDKFQKTAFTPVYNGNFSVPTIQECPTSFECTVVQKNQVKETNFAEKIIGEYYVSGDFHSVYFGEIVKVNG